MAKIVLAPVTNTNTISTINQNFDDLAGALQNQVLYRDNPEGETNTVVNPLDLDGNDLINVSAVHTGSLFIGDDNILTLIDGGAGQAAEDAIAAAEAAVISANNAAAQATAASTSAGTAAAQAGAAATSATNAAASAALAASEGATAGAAAAATAVNAVKADLAETSTSTKNAGMIGFNYALSYASGTLGKWLKDLAANVGSSFIGWYQAGVNSVLRTAEDKMREVVSIKDFGGIGNDSTDNLAAFNSAITYLASVGGGTLKVPRGIYRISNEIAIGTPNITIQGDGRGASIIKQTNTAASSIRVYGGAGVQEYFTCHGMGFTTLGTPTGGAAIYLNDAPFSNLYNLSFRNVYIGVRCQSGYLSKLQDFDIRDAKQNGVLIQSTNDFFVRNFGIITTNGSGWFLAGGIRLEDFCEAIVIETGDVVGGLYSLTIDAGSYGAGTRPAYNRFTNVYFDSSANTVAQLNNCILINFDSCWFSGGRDVAASGVFLNQTNEINFNGCSFFNNGAHGCIVSSASVRTRFINCNFESNDANAVGGNGLEVASNVGNLTVQSCTFGNGLYSGVQNYGMNINAGTSNNITVMGNDFVNGGSVAGFVDSSGGAQKFISSNRV